MNKTKVLLVTLYGCTNLGNRLQNYALQTILEKNNCEVHNLCYQQKIAFARTRNFIKCFFTSIGLFRSRFSVYIESNTDKYIDRKKKFVAFNEKYIKNKIYIGKLQEAFKINWDEFSFGVTGSDQVWHNWSSTDEELAYYYLQFLPKEKRMSYAPSFGFSKFPPKDEALHKKYLLGMNKLSCREIEGCHLIKKLCGREAEYVLDPTLLLNSAEWYSIAKKPRYFDGDPYMVVYFLGDISDKAKFVIKSISEKYNLSIINLLSPGNEDYYKTDPQEFIYLIANSDFVITDSFHGTVFSVIFERNFFVFKRQKNGIESGMFARIGDFLDTFYFTDRIYTGDNNEYMINNFDKRYQTVCEILNKLQKQCMQYIKSISK